MSRFIKMRSLGIVMLILILAAAIYGFAAANTVPSSYAGDGSGTIDGYTIQNVHYALNATTPSNIDMVQFDIAENATNPPATVYVKLESVGGTWFSCAAGSGAYDWDCDLSASPVAVLDADQLTVVAAE